MRLYYIDWLRVLAVFLLFFFHTARIFDPWEEFYVHGQVSDKIYNVFIWAVGPWHMSLFFLLAGASTWFALQRRTPRRYSRERFLRLLVPFLIGSLIFIPPQSYIGLLSHAGTSDSFFSWFPDFFTLQSEDMDGYFLGGYTWGHLWFIIHLFAYSMLLLPLLMFLRGDKGARVIDKLASVVTKPILIYLVPVTLLILDIPPEILGGRPFYYMGLFVYGFIIVSDPRFMDAIDRQRFAMLVLGPLAQIAIIAAVTQTSIRLDHPGVTDALFDYQDSFVPWFTILALLAFGRRMLNFSNRFLAYFGEASYPLYILHQTVIIIIGYFVIRWSLALPLKFTLIVAASFSASLIVYDLFARRTNATRFVFGMRLKR